MDNTTQPLAAETDALRAAYEALNRNDMPVFAAVFDSQIEWTDPVESPAAGTYFGYTEVVAHLSQARASWAEGRCEPERFMAAGDKVIVFVHVRVRLKHETEWREGRLADVYTFRNGKAVQVRSFVDRQQALDWVKTNTPASPAPPAPEA